MLALCGQSGMGKSTVIKLIQRLYDPTQGRVTLDGASSITDPDSHPTASVARVMLKTRGGIP